MLNDRDLEAGRFHEADSEWLRSFALDAEGLWSSAAAPCASEAFEIFDAMGIAEYGMLLSEKDSVVYPRCLAPELRGFRFPARTCTGSRTTWASARRRSSSASPRSSPIARAITDYTHLFAGYGFMAEDAEFVEADRGGRVSASWARPSTRDPSAGAKDEAKKLARALGNAVIPGVDDVSARALTLQARVADRKALEALAGDNGLAFSLDEDVSARGERRGAAAAGYAATVELVTIAELQAEAEIDLRRTIWQEYPATASASSTSAAAAARASASSNRSRRKWPSGRDGRARRVEGRRARLEPELPVSSSTSRARGTTRSSWSATASGRVSLGGRDCSVQMHEQKLLEVSLTQELLDAEIGAQPTGKSGERSCAATRRRSAHGGEGESASVRPPGSTASRPSSASSRASTTSSWR